MIDDWFIINDYTYYFTNLYVCKKHFTVGPSWMISSISWKCPPVTVVTVVTNISSFFCEKNQSSVIIQPDQWRKNELSWPRFFCIPFAISFRYAMVVESGSSCCCVSFIPISRSPWASHQTGQKLSELGRLQQLELSKIPSRTFSKLSWRLQHSHNRYHLVN